jgi:hypothetical protein
MSSAYALESLVTAMALQGRSDRRVDDWVEEG